VSAFFALFFYFSFPPGKQGEQKDHAVFYSMVTASSYKIQRIRAMIF
jgi:hypothetical protein